MDSLYSCPYQVRRGVWNVPQSQCTVNKITGKRPPLGYWRICSLANTVLLTPRLDVKFKLNLDFPHLSYFMDGKNKKEEVKIQVDIPVSRGWISWCSWHGYITTLAAEA